MPPRKPNEQQNLNQMMMGNEQQNAKMQIQDMFNQANFFANSQQQPSQDNQGGGNINPYG